MTVKELLKLTDEQLIRKLLGYKVKTLEVLTFGPSAKKLLDRVKKIVNHPTKAIKEIQELADKTRRKNQCRRNLCYKYNKNLHTV